MAGGRDTARLNPAGRAAALDALSQDEVQVLVVGGGVVGAGIALDAVTRGLFDRPAGGPGLRLGHLVAVQQADPRRAALP